MKKVLVFTFTIALAFAVYFFSQKEGSESSSSGSQSHQSKERYAETSANNVAAKTDVHEPMEGSTSSNNENSLKSGSEDTQDPDVILYRQLYSLPADSDESVIQDALVNIAVNATDVEKALNVFHEYGIPGYTPRSLIINRFAKDNPELAKSSVQKLILEYQNIADDDIKTSSAICGSIGNINTVDATDAIISAIKREPSTRKRHCLFGIFSSYRNLSEQKQKEIINLAVNDEAKEIQQTGLIWKKSGRVLDTAEMSKEYEKMMGKSK